MRNSPSAITSPAFIQTDQNRTYIFSSFVHGKFYNSNKYLHQLYVDIKHLIVSDNWIPFLH
jgi:hypothetical protein